MPGLNIKLSDATGVPFYRQIVDQVSHQVHAGELEPGALMPSVRELAAELLVSLITVRRAYSDLEHAGLIVRKQGRGTFVSETVAESARSRARQDGLDELEASVIAALQRGLSRDEVLRHVSKVLEEHDR